MSKETQNIELSSIKDPTFLKTLNLKETLFLCNQIRNEIIKECSINGGHLSSNLGVVESFVSLHRVFDFSKDKLLIDVGHQCYTHKILTGRSLENLRKKDGVAGFPKRDESIYDCFEGGHSSNSISNAIGMAIERDRKGDKYDIVTYIGDASISNGLSFEALNDVNLSKHKVIIVLNENGMSISKNVGRTSMLFSKISTSGLYSKTKLIAKRLESKGPFLRRFYCRLYNFKNKIKRILLHKNIFTDLGLVYYGIVDGHDIKKLDKAFLKAKKCSKSCIIHIKTIKGYGYKLAQDDKVGYYHGVAPFDIPTGKPLNKQKTTFNNCFDEAIENSFKNNKNIIVLCPGTLVGSKLCDIKSIYPHSIIDTGITEEHTVSMAAGLALNGCHPIVSIYSTFLQRAFDELSHDIAREKLNVTLLIDRCGLVGPDGDTHNGPYDEAFLMNTPNTVVAMPSNKNEALKLFNESLNNHGLFAIRFPKYGYIDNKVEEDIPFGQWKYVIKNNTEIVVISFGPVVNEIEEAIKGKKIDLINAIYQKPIDLTCLKACLDYKKIIVFNQYGTKAGFNNCIASFLLENNYKGIFISAGLKDSFTPTQTIQEGLIENEVDIQSFKSLIN